MKAGLSLCLLLYSTAQTPIVQTVRPVETAAPRRVVQKLVVRAEMCTAHRSQQAMCTVFFSARNKSFKRPMRGRCGEATFHDLRSEETLC